MKNQLYLSIPLLVVFAGLLFSNQPVARPVLSQEIQAIEKKNSELNFGCATCHTNGSFFDRSKTYIDQIKKHATKNSAKAKDLFNKHVSDMAKELNIKSKENKYFQLAVKGVLAKQKRSMDQKIQLLSKLAKIREKQIKFDETVSLSKDEWAIIDSVKESLRTNPHQFFQELNAGSIVPKPNIVDIKNLTESKRWQNTVKKLLDKTQQEKYQELKKKLYKQAANTL